MPIDPRKLRPKRKFAPAVVTFTLGTEETPPRRLTTEGGDYLICEQSSLSTNTFKFFDFTNFKFF